MTERAVPVPTRKGLTPESIAALQKSPHAGPPSRKRTMLLLRGISGAGKSTAAAALLDVYPTAVSVEADSFFVVGDHYEFDPTMLESAHNLAHSNARTGLEAGADLVIIANTFTQAWEMVSYVEMAESFNYHIEVRDLYDGGVDDQELARRNIHGVPLDKIKAMRKRYEVGTKFAIPTGPWSDTQRAEFLEQHTQGFVNNNYFGVAVPDGQCLEAAPLLVSLVQEVGADAFVRDCERRLLRNVPKFRKNPKVKPHAFHVTLVTPPELQKLTPTVAKTLESALRKAARQMVNVKGAGTMKVDQKHCIYFSVAGPAIDAAKVARDAAGLTGPWTPHITVGFGEGGDVHGIEKHANIDASGGSRPTSLADQRAWEETVDFIRCALHPGISWKYSNHVLDAIPRKGGGMPDDMTYLKYPDLQPLLLRTPPCA